MSLLFVGIVACILAGVPFGLFYGLYALWTPEGSPADKRRDEPTVSIVLPTYNEASIVESKLEDLLALDYPMAKVEVVVVDSSDDATPDLVESFFADRDAPSLTLIREGERRGLAAALNDAYAAAENEMVVKTDCDSRIAPDALREAAANLADPEVGAVTGRNAEVLGGSEVETDYRGMQGMVQTLESHLDSTLIFHGPFSAFENDRVVPIDPESIADDTELALKIRKGGARVVYDPAIRFKEASFSDFSKRRSQKDRRAMGLVRLLFQHRDAVFDRSLGLYGLVVLPFNWAFMVLSPWLLALGLGSLTVGFLTTFPPLGLAFLLGLGGFVALGSRDRLGSLQPAYALFDTQVSLFWASVKLLRGEGGPIWEVDEELREAYK
ncbi:glycosyltransferase [Halobium salinum]|uniref:Glycosyltransferase n=1 Tax=Halobium salinum TaxID=1364940 RepID=A0ABD5P650_9EURY|nr:glycosyltransferase [Halobium salinum]